KKGTPKVVTMPTTKASATSILGVISTTRLINVMSSKTYQKEKVFFCIVYWI
ncbi:hypothetical protein CLU79DRAFT_712385, partial [Phycomyces nitens]